ncbi:hypothetical protein C8R45DRAFT_607906 [Mycena sanguinolenta]|nr:hypothetical protein C8R45DRAFT_607906 [Mycena sanguinolenta]
MHETTLIAEDLCAWCAATPDMNVFQPMAASALELCHAAAKLVCLSVESNKAQKLAAFAVKETEKIIIQLGPFPLSPEIVRNVEAFETKLDEIRRSFGKMRVRSKNKAKLVMDQLFNRDTRRLKAELKRISHALLKCSDNPSSKSGIRSEYILELASLSTRAASAICDAPVLNFLKPIVGIAETICDTAKTVKSNRDAALELAKHSSAVTKAIVDHAAALDIPEASNGEGLGLLKSALEDIRLYLTSLQQHCRRPIRWIMANQDKDRIVQLNCALDKALAIFTSTNVLNAHGELRSLVRLNKDMNQTLTTMHAELTSKTVVAVPGPDGERNSTVFVPFSAIHHTAHFF